jgi:hypothetical protein
MHLPIRSKLFPFRITAMSRDHGDADDLLVYQYVRLTLSSHTE